MTTATKITFARVILIPVFIVCMYLANTFGAVMHYVALAVFAIASLTDLVDGKIARKYHQVTDLGKFLDPLADKVLVIAAMVMLCEQGLFPAWAVMIVLAREFAVSGLRMIAASKGKVIAAGWSGKVKTAVTMTGICFMLFLNTSVFADLLGLVVLHAVNWCVIAAVSLTTLYSGIEYFIQNRSVFEN